LHVLLLVGIDQVMERHPGDGEHWLAVQLGVIQAVQQMDATRSGSGQADSQLPRVLGVGAGHESSRLLMPDVDEADLVLTGPQRLHDSVDAVPREAEDDLYPPIVDGVNQYVGG